jgi:hypothetical protein
MPGGGVINTGTHPKLLWPGVYETWGQTYDEHTEEYPDLYDMRDSEKALEQEVQVTPFGLAPVKAQGAPISYDSETQGMITTYSHIAYALGYIVTKEELDDNLYQEVATRRAEGNAFSMRQTVENVCAFLYNNAFSTTFFTTADGAALISASHVNATGGTWSNLITVAADLAEASLEALTIQIMQASNDTGLLISLMPQSLHIPVQEWYNANRILGSVLQSSTSLNAINVLKATNVFPKGLKLNHYFTDTDAWFIRTNARNGMRMFWRQRPDFATDNDFDTKNAKAASYMRFSVGCTDPRGLYASPGV